MIIKRRDTLKTLETTNDPCRKESAKTDSARIADPDQGNSIIPDSRTASSLPPAPADTAKLTPLDRSQTVDILRGIAIFTMIAANQAGNMLAEPHPIALRLYGSFAAPLFIMLSGMMVARSSRRNLQYYLLRGGLVLLTGILVDVLIFHWYPMHTCDVLYLIGISMPIAYLVGRMEALPRWGLLLAIFLLTPLVQQLLGYQQTTPDLLIGEHPLSEVLSHPENSIRHFIAAGWFPLFPWIAFSLFGVNLHFLSIRLGSNFRAVSGH
jgi:uncharacterized membrane protein